MPAAAKTLQETPRKEASTPTTAMTTPSQNTSRQPDYTEMRKPVEFNDWDLDHDKQVSHYRPKYKRKINYNLKP